MLDFINNNAVLFTGICSLITALLTALITACVTVYIGNKNTKWEVITGLQKDLEATRKELNATRDQLVSLQNAETLDQSLDKTHGSIYYETLPTGKQRTICGFCWERSHLKIPVIVDTYYDGDDRPYDGAYCNCCKNQCIDCGRENYDFLHIDDFGDELPF